MVRVRILCIFNTRKSITCTYDWLIDELHINMFSHSLLRLLHNRSFDDHFNHFKCYCMIYIYLTITKTRKGSDLIIFSFIFVFCYHYNPYNRRLSIIKDEILNILRQFMSISVILLLRSFEWILLLIRK